MSDHRLIRSWEDEFERCRGWIEDALKYEGGAFSIDDIRQGIANQQYQLWPGAKSCIVTEIIEYPQMRVLHFFLCGGDIEELLRMEESVLTLGEVSGCKAALLAGRFGWERVLKERGWRKDHVVLMKMISADDELAETASSEDGGPDG